MGFIKRQKGISVRKLAVGVGSEVPSGEVLAEITGTNGKYHACSDGHIYCFSNARNCSKRGRPFKVMESIGSNGYPFIGVSINGVKRSQIVHSWILSAFHGQKPNPKWCARHLDGNKTNNRPTNLKWGSFSENEADKRRHGTASIGEKQGSSKLTEEAVRIIRASIPFGLWNTEDASKVFGVTLNRIASIARGVGWRHVKP